MNENPKGKRELQDYQNWDSMAFDSMKYWGTLVAIEDISVDKAKEKVSKTVVTVDVVVPAFNEESCINGILRDIVIAKQDDWFKIQTIYVISDASTDETDDIVQQIAARDSRINLIRKQERKGKQDSINLAFSISRADILVFVDADVRFANEHSLTKLLQRFQEGKTALVQGGLVRGHPGFTLQAAKLAAHFDWILVDRIRRRKPISWWSIDARVMALSRDFYQNLVLLPSLADDQYIFYSCIQQGRQFAWADDAVFYYGPPHSITDFSHQWSRYFFYTSKSRQYFGRDLIDEYMSVPGLRRTILSTLLYHPLCGLMWVLCYTMSKIEFLLRVDFDKYERGFFWTKSGPLRNIDQTYR